MIDHGNEQVEQDNDVDYGEHPKHEQAPKPTEQNSCLLMKFSHKLAQQMSSCIGMIDHGNEQVEQDNDVDDGEDPEHQQAPKHTKKCMINDEIFTKTGTTDEQLHRNDSSWQ
jgi:hypothetical protein